MPDGKWTFDGEVTAVFENMLERSIPQYQVMRTAVFEVGKRFVTPHTAIVDLGCSNGLSLEQFVRHFGAQNRFVGIDVSDPMIESAQERLKGSVEAGIAKILKVDLREDLPVCNASLVLSVLCLQFTPIEHRPHILKRVYDALNPGGGFVLVEKILGREAGNDGMLKEIYYNLKYQHGYSKEQVERKRLSLEGVLVPVTAKGNEDFLTEVGFKRIECFWRWMNFAGWVAVK